MNQRQSFTFPQSSFQFGPNITSLSLRPTLQPLPIPVSPAATDDGSTAVATPSGQSCGQCQSADESVRYCSKCCCFLCKPCTDSHKRMATFNTHDLVLPEEADIASKYNCPKHSSESLNAYCMTCKCLICQDCELCYHYKHETKSVTSARESIKAHLKSDFECLLKHLKSFQSHSEEIAEAEKHTTSYPHKLKGFISENVKDTEHKDKLLKEVDTHYSQYSKALSTEKDSVNKAIGMLESEIKSADQLMKNSKLSLLEFAVQGCKSMSSMDKLKSMIWNPINFGPLLCVNDKLVSARPVKTGGWGPPTTSASTSDTDIKLINGSVSFSINEPITSFHIVKIDFKWTRMAALPTNFRYRSTTKLLFPDFDISCVVIGPKQRAVPCKIDETSKSNDNEASWNISAKTESPFTIKAELKLNGDVYRQISKYYKY
uniref:B box-type domain-containing protein n=1 Tax=Amphimedon queenslandica TaxID=400682 RepID=A0A1X7UYP6_AMPQE